jgi:hypothetical protein
MRPSLLLIVAATLAPARLRADAPVDYLRDIKPVLAAKCFSCHGALQQKADLRLDTVKAMLQGGESGASVVPGQAARSVLLDRVLGRHNLRRMPPKSDGEPLSDGQVALLTRWIEAGAHGPANEQPEADPRAHWAFRAPVRSAVPVLRAGGNPVDAFLAAERTQRALSVCGPADKRTLLRRVYLDLIGLPPTRAEQAAFLSDPSPDAYEKVVERLLASPQHGERWARHWMDLWRYSDAWGLGAEVRNSQKHMWHWRDWILESLNTDKGYDQMLREMLAADELYPNDLSRLRATGYLARQYFLFNRTTWLDETIEHTSKAFLGLTLNCAKCHDHKYDPLPQADYYRMRAFFEPYQVRLEQVPRETDYAKDALPRVFDNDLSAPTYLFIRGDDRKPAKERPLAPALPGVLTWAKLDIQPVPLPPEAHNPGLRPHVLANYLSVEEEKLQAARKALQQSRRPVAPGLLAAAEAKIVRLLLTPYPPEERLERAVATIEAQISSLKARAAADRATARGAPAVEIKELAQRAAWSERYAALAKAQESLTTIPVQKKEEVDKQRAAAHAALAKARKALQEAGEAYTPLRGAQKAPSSNLETGAALNRPFPTTSTGRRSALAGWMTDRRNPLTARVAVNHIWARHFGRPLVETVFDFGRKGSAPSHPALLDYLAVEFMESGWSMKHLHRLLVTSDAYRLSSASAGAEPKTRQADPENRYYWRMNSTRMEAQVLRDSLLSLAGALDPKLGGPSIPVKDEDSRRRSLYYVHSHNDQQRFLGLFDDAGVRECYRRSESIVPQQALALSNSKLALGMAERVAAHLQQTLGSGPDADFVRGAFETILANTPSPEELAECTRAVQEWRALAKARPDAGPRARRLLVQALVNHNDFLTIR